MTAPVRPGGLRAPGGDASGARAFEPSRWVAGPASGLEGWCPVCRPAPRRAERDPRSWLDGTARPDTAALAAACAVAGFRQHEQWALQAAALVRRARRSAQRLFPYGVGPVLGDLKLPADGGGDLLAALTDVFWQMFAAGRGPRPHPLCPRGSTDPADCPADAFGRRVHDGCTTPTGPVPGWRSRSWAVWTLKVATAVDRLGPVRPARALTTAELARRGTTSGVIGPITLLIDPNGPAGRAGHGRGALSTLAARLAPPGMPFIRVLGLLHRQLDPPRGGPYVWGWRGYAPRTAFAAALRARHAVLHHGPGDIEVTEFVGFWAIDRPVRRVADGLLQDGWDDLPRPDSEVAALLRRAASTAAGADTPLWERKSGHYRVLALHDADTLRAAAVTDDGPGQELLDLLDRLMAKLSPQDRAVATCYSRIDGLTWAQAALRSGAPAAAGERARRKLKRLRDEDLRRRGRPSPN